MCASAGAGKLRFSAGQFVCALRRPGGARELHFGEVYVEAPAAKRAADVCACADADCSARGLRAFDAQVGREQMAILDREAAGQLHAAHERQAVQLKR